MSHYLSSSYPSVKNFSTEEFQGGEFRIEVHGSRVNSLVSLLEKLADGNVTEFSLAEIYTAKDLLESIKNRLISILTIVEGY